MKVRILFQGILSDWAGVSQAEIFLPKGGNLGDLLSEIRKNYGPQLPPQLRDKEQTAFSRAFWVIRKKEKLSEPGTTLKDGDELQFLLPLAGG